MAVDSSTPGQVSAPRWHSPLGVRTRLVASSALMLFLELALIRWTGSNVVHLSYFSNFVLLGSFLGIGIGILRSGRAKRLPYYSPVMLGLLVAVIAWKPVTVDRGSSSSVIYFTSLNTTGPPVWVILPIVFVAAAVVLAGPAELVGRCFAELPRLTAYRYDLIGSLIGIVGFTGLSFLGAPPIWWGVIVTLSFVVLMVPRQQQKATATALSAALVLTPLLVMVGVLFHESTQPENSWSPYYKVQTKDSEFQGVPLLTITVNGVPHQQAIPAASRLQWEPQYGMPYERAVAGKQPGNVLIIGAGSGTDVAIALSKGAKHVDAVEIDPRIRDIGRERNPDKSYQDPRVTSHIDDGRAFLSRTDKKYDLILLALPDSLTLVNGASSLRLESYLFTQQAFESARDHLAPGGAFAMYNYYRETWLIDRLASTAQAAFGHKPCVDKVGDDLQQAVVTVGLTEADQSCGSTWAGATAITPPPATDNRPFLYLFTDRIPSLYLITLGLILVAGIIGVGIAGGGSSYRRMRPYADLFLLGAGFMLLETKSITGFALLFGTTWVVNAIVFAGVLVAVLAAVEVTRRFKTPPLKVMYVVLFGGLLLSWVFPDSWLLSMPVGPRALVAVLIAFLPIFAANVIFAKRFTDTADGTASFGANLLGAMLGGCLEYAALIIGFDGLLIVAALLYAGAFLLSPKPAGVLRT
ncbi:spermidine synthase [Kribbella sp. VKM Ac-2568]|uniref:spermine/spermidine synthase domain-containing protein n=1 Tax=Kribbella sp. VKM Ac-2568 TaxID=2512219 RepID=UPI001044C6EA|nr:spermidine synthase [Kribbella sp. VKM Ac-2568]TCM37866.1 spermine/spermidine synthase [Kribbella sp. VKM Ac-2568]